MIISGSSGHQRPYYANCLDDIAIAELAEWLRRIPYPVIILNSELNIKMEVVRDKSCEFIEISYPHRRIKFRCGDKVIDLKGLRRELRNLTEDCMELTWKRAVNGSKTLVLGLKRDKISKKPFSSAKQRKAFLHSQAHMALSHIYSRMHCFCDESENNKLTVSLQVEYPCSNL